MKKFLLLFFISIHCFSQVTNKGEPQSWNHLQNESSITANTLPSFNLKALQEEDKLNDFKNNVPWRFGYMHSVDYGFEHGQWDTLENGDRIWRILIHSPKALSLNLIFDQYYLPEGASLYLYNNERTELLGAYTSIQNQESSVLATWLIKGDKLWVEYHEPANVIGQGKLHIAKVTHGYRNADTYNVAQGLNNSGPCNLDVDCPIGADWQTFKDNNKHSVGLLITGSSICTGALINNSSNDGTPYFLTSNSCFSNPESWTFRFGWISPNPVCASDDNSTDSENSYIISGATLKARNEASDFCLVEINNDLPEEWNTVLAGWDKADNFPEFQVGIHHPTADIMKICRDDDTASKEIHNSIETWEINGGADGGWELGTTEGGSLGSPLFDQYGKIIGQLSGGSASCNGTNDNGENNFYGRIGISWDTGDTPETRLRDWLDPEGTNPDSINSYPPLESYDLDGGIMISFNSVNCPNTEVAPILTFTNYGTGPITNATLEWRLNQGDIHEITFDGNLSQYESEEYYLQSLILLEGINEVHATIINVNGASDENVENNTFTDTVEAYNFESYDTSQVHLELVTDNYPGETSWVFRNSEGVVIYEGGPYEEDEANTTFNYSFDVDYDSCYSFEIFDSYGDGICCGFGDGSYSLATDDDTIIASGGEFEFEEITEDISIDEPLDLNNYTLNTLLVYPNPTKGKIHITMENDLERYNYSIVNLLGQEIKTGFITNGINTISLENLQNGLYFITVVNQISKQAFVQKIVKE